MILNTSMAVAYLFDAVSRHSCRSKGVITGAVKEPQIASILRRGMSSVDKWGRVSKKGFRERPRACQPSLGVTERVSLANSQQSAPTCMPAWRVGSGVAQPHIHAHVIGSKGLGACHPIGHPANGRVQDAVHEKHHISGPCVCTLAGSLMPKSW